MPHTHGGVWSGDDLIAEHAPFRADSDVVRGKLKSNRIKVIVKTVNNVYEFLIAEKQKEILLKDENFDVPEAEEASEDETDVAESRMSSCPTRWLRRRRR